MKIEQLILIIFFILFFFLLPLKSLSANSSSVISLRGNILEVKEEQKNFNNEEIIIKKYLIELSTSEIVEVESEFRPEIQSLDFKVGDKVVVDKSTINNEVRYVITDFQRTDYIILLVIVFVILVLLVAKKNGFYSLISLVISYFLIFEILIKNISNGGNAFILSIFTAIAVIPFNYYLGHGVSRKTTYAVLGTIITLLIIGVFSVWIVDSAKLTGYTSDEAGFLFQLTNGLLNLKDLLIAGVIIGILGILDDITISQASIANQLKASKPEMKLEELFSRTITVGKDHISSLVNTLILVYTSTALPLLIILYKNNSDFLTTLNREVITEQIIIMLLTSIGLILAVPITTYISCYFISRFGPEDKENNDHHHHHHH